MQQAVSYSAPWQIKLLPDICTIKAKADASEAACYEESYPCS
jgi:hypothetical protein